MRYLIALAALAVATSVAAQAPPPGNVPAKPKAQATAPSAMPAAPTPAATPAPMPAAPMPATPPSSMQANPASAPVHGNGASVPVQPASDAGATERGLAPVQPATGVQSPAGVTNRVRNAANHDTDANGHVVDPHGKPVGQAPAVPSTVH
ncbi:hypothetical protein KPL74_06915 [Bacillus sp. NP157]|nr:hypothetical protein KPL74_06915 [Bacillus sp. NP157]